MYSAWRKHRNITSSTWQHSSPHSSPIVAMSVADKYLTFDKTTHMLKHYKAGINGRWKLSPVLLKYCCATQLSTFVVIIVLLRLFVCVCLCRAGYDMLSSRCWSSCDGSSAGCKSPLQTVDRQQSIICSDCWLWSAVWPRSISPHSTTPFCLHLESCRYRAWSVQVTSEQSSKPTFH